LRAHCDKDLEAGEKDEDQERDQDFVDSQGRREHHQFDRCGT
jgi:hypothetical protein